AEYENDSGIFSINNPSPGRYSHISVADYLQSESVLFGSLYAKPSGTGRYTLSFELQLPNSVIQPITFDTVVGQQFSLNGDAYAIPPTTNSTLYTYVGTAYLNTKFPNYIDNEPIQFSIAPPLEDSIPEPK